MRKEQETSVSEQAQLPENSFKLIVNLPIGQELDFVVMPTTTVQEIRQVVYDSPKAQFLTCFYLAFNGKRLIDGQELQSIQEFEPAILEAVPGIFLIHLR
jgi:protein TIF31